MIDLAEEANEANLSFVLNDYVRAMNRRGLDGPADCGCCTNRQNALVALNLLRQLGSDLIDADIQILAERIEAP